MAPPIVYQESIPGFGREFATWDEWVRTARRGRPENFREPTRLLEPQDGHQFLHRCGGLVERRLFFRKKLDLDNLLDASRAKFCRHADEEALDAVFAFEIRRAGKYFL